MRLLVLLLLVMLPAVASFATAELFGQILRLIKGSKFHTTQTRTALCTTQYHYLKRNNGLNTAEPAMYAICPYMQWFHNNATPLGDTLTKYIAVEYAKESIAEAVTLPDVLSPMDKDPLFHFGSDEKLIATNVRLTQARLPLIKAIRDGSFNDARYQLGLILHTLQDFYSHTNWVELGRVDVNRNIGNSANLGIAISSDVSCKNCSHDDATEEEKQFIENNKWYLHLWPGKTSISNVFVCRDNIITNALVSGYYTGEGMVKPPGKCSHGTPTDFTTQTSATGGISKDTNTPLSAPHYYLHEAAAEISVRATIQYLEDLRLALGDEAAFGTLIGLEPKPVMSILIDTTGSMRPSIDAVKYYAQQMVLAATDEDVFYITPFNDPEYGPVLKYTDPQLLVDFIGSLTADGGGDTPEKCFAALLDTVREVPENTNVYIFTDASSKDPELKSAISNIATQKKLTINFMMAGEYTGVHAGKRSKQQASGEERMEEDAWAASQTSMQDYRDLAAISSGTYLVAIGSEELQDATKLMATSNWQQLLISPLSNGTTEYVIDVDDTVIQVEISINANEYYSTEYVIASLTTSAGDSLISNVTLAYSTPRATVYRINTTAPDTWNLRLENARQNGTVTVRVLSFLTSGLLMYDDYVFFDGTPIAGHDYQLVVQCESCKNMTEVTVSNCADGTMIQTALPSLVDGTDDWWTINVTMPNAQATGGQLCIVMAGTTMNGAAFRRIVQEKVQVSTMSIAASVPEAAVYPGDNATVSWIVTQFGNVSSTFKITVTSSAPFPIYIGTYDDTLSGNDTVSGIVTITADGNIGDVASVELTVVSDSGFSSLSDLTFYISDPDPDVSAPVCTIRNTTQAQCPTSASACAAATYDVYLDVDEDKKGIARVVFDNGAWTLDADTSSDNTTLRAAGTISCCSGFVFSVVDGGGLIGSCQIAALPTDSTPLPSTSSTPVHSTPLPSTSSTPVHSSPLPSTSSSPAHSSPLPSTSSSPAQSSPLPSSPSSPSPSPLPFLPLFVLSFFFII